jgi:hypothetical protein
MVWPLLVFGTVGPALADPPSEEIVVWGDRFARWEHRWHVETEIRLPYPLAMIGWRNTETELSAIQVRAVLSCDKDFEQWGRSWEVHCDIEDIGIVGMPVRRARHDAALLREIDATLSGASVQLQVHEAGGVPNLDLEGVSAHDQRTRARRESLRQLMSRVMLPFHLSIPTPIYDGKQWYEPHSRLVSIPCDQGTHAGITLAHHLDALDPEWFVVRSLGEASARPFSSDGTRRIDTFDLDVGGVAMIRRSDGVMTERVWSVSGGLTPSSASVLDALVYSHTGHLRILGPDEAPDVGRTAVTARTGWAQDADRPPWVPMSF